MPEFQQIIDPHRTYKTYDGAMKRLNEAFGEQFSNIRYIIMATPDGRFSPVVIARHSDGGMLVSWCAANDMPVIG